LLQVVGLFESEVVHRVPTETALVRGGQWSRKAAINYRVEDEENTLYAVKSDANNPNFSRTLLLKFDIGHKTGNKNKMCLALHVQGLTDPLHSITIFDLNSTDWTIGSATWSEFGAITLPRLINASLIYNIEPDWPEGWLLFSGVEKLTKDGFLSVGIVAGLRDRANPVFISSVDVVDLSPRLFLAACPKTRANGAKLVLEAPILDISYPNIVQRVSHAKPPPDMHISMVSEDDLSRFTFRPMNPTFHGEQVLVRYSNAHQCAAERIDTSKRSSFILFSDRKFSYWHLNSLINSPRLAPNCYRGLEDPRSFNRTHFLASIQIGEQCIQHQALVSTGEIKILNSPWYGYKRLPHEKNWVLFQDDGELIHSFLDSDLVTTLIICRESCVVSRRFQWQVSYGDFPVRNLRSGSNWLPFPEHASIRFAILHNKVIVNSIIAYHSHYAWWDTESNNLIISGPVWHTRPLCKSQFKGLVEFVTSIKFSSSTVVDVAYGSGDCHAIVSSVDIVQLKFSFDEQDYYIAHLSGEEMQAPFEMRKAAAGVESWTTVHALGNVNMKNRLYDMASKMIVEDSPSRSESPSPTWLAGNLHNSISKQTYHTGHPSTSDRMTSTRRQNTSSMNESYSAQTVESRRTRNNSAADVPITNITLMAENVGAKLRRGREASENESYSAQTVESRRTRNNSAADVPITNITLMAENVGAKLRRGREASENG
jgi:hypothetical protein